MITVGQMIVGRIESIWKGVQRFMCEESLWMNLKFL